MSRRSNGANGSNGAGADVKRCAIYTRKSTARGLEQEFSSLDAQREACEQYIASQVRLGWKLVDERYDDGGFTGANLERPAFQRLLDDLDAGKIDVVVVYKVDRLSRSLLDFARVMERFGRTDTAFVSVTQNFSTADAIGRLTLNMLMSFAEFEREMIGERTRDKIAASRRRGKWTGGMLPIGYKAINKKLVIDELEAVVVREIYELYEQHRSALSVARTINERGRQTKRYRSAAGTLKSGRRWSKDAVLRILKNPVYAGLIPYGDELYEGEHDAIIDPERFKRMKHLLSGHGRRSRARGRNPEYILRGLLRCSCGKALTPASTRKGGREYRYYRCVTQDKHGRKSCPARPLPAEAIETFVVDKVRDVAADPRLVDELFGRLQCRIEERREPLKTERRKIPTRIASLSAEAQRLAEDIGRAEGPARNHLDKRLGEVGDDIARAEARLAEVERMLAQIDCIEIDARWVTETLSQFDAAWDILSHENRGRLVRAIIKQVDVDEPNGTIAATVADLGLDEVITAEVAEPPTKKRKSRARASSSSDEARP